ncbi:DUF3140 domain-containing protein [Nonomuraea sp. NPDC002799]
MTEEVDIGRLWEDFHRGVNMTSEELRAYLLAAASDEEGFPPDPDLGIDELGRAVLHVLNKRKTDLTKTDIEVMQQVVELVETLDSRTDDDSRRALLTVGHDPLRG